MLPLPQSWDFLLLLPAPYKVRFRLILSQRLHFLQNFTAFCFLLFLSNSMLMLSTKLKTSSAENPTSLLLGPIP